jgi:hypothetical protein
MSIRQKIVLYVGLIIALYVKLMKESKNWRTSFIGEQVSADLFLQLGE